MLLGLVGGGAATIQEVDQVIAYLRSIQIPQAEAVAEVERELAGAGRVILRPSGTEPLVRVTLEGADPALVQRILASGKNVVTPLNWFYPGKRDVSALEAACRKGGSTLHGTGIHPGGITERFPLMVSALSSASSAIP